MKINLLFFKNHARFFILNYFYSCLFNENSLLLIPRKKTFVTTNKRLFTLQNQFLFASNPISVCICCCCCANKACIRCCIISYYWLCWLIADLHFLFIQVFLNFALFFFFFSSLLFLVTIWRIYLSFFLAISWISKAFWLCSAKIVLAHLFTMCCSDRSHYCNPGYLAGKYSTISAIHNLGLTFCYQRFVLSFFVALPAQGSDNILPCIPSFTISTFVLWNTFSNYFAKHLDVFLF